MRRLYPIFAAAVILAMTLTGCAAPATDQPEPTPITPGGASPQGTLGLAEELRGAGAAVELGEKTRQDFFEPEGQILLVDGEPVQVFEWPSAAQAAEAAAAISADASSVGTTMITWVDTPHFYAEGSLIVLYVGSDAAVEALLADALGDPIAVGAAPWLP